MKYTVEYKNHFADNVNEIEIYAKNKIEAYEKAVYETIPEIPYSAWCRLSSGAACGRRTFVRRSAAVGLVWRSATHGLRSASSLAKFPNVITAGRQKIFLGGSAL